MASIGPEDRDIHATLAISQAEALNGTVRTLTLPRGRTITVPIAPGVRNGEEIRLSGQGEPSRNGGPAGDLILTISISTVEQNAGQTYHPMGGTDLPTEFTPVPPPPPMSTSSPTYLAGGTINAYTNYSPPRQDQLYLPQIQPDYAQQAPYYGAQQPYQPVGPVQPPPQGPRRRSSFSTIITLLLIILVLLLLAGGGLLYYAGVYQPNQLHAQATATAQAQATATVQANSQATAQALTAEQTQATATAVAQLTATAQVTATATGQQGIYNQATSGTPTLNDPLTGQDANNWQVTTSSVNGTCAFTGGGYHSTIPQKGYFQPCFAETPTYSNFAFQVQMTIIKGDRGGFIFRADDAASKFYLFRISSDGNYNLFLYVGSAGSSAKSLLNSTSSLINKGTNQLNTLTVIAQGSNLYFYINQQYLAMVTDSTYTSGKIGLFAESSTNPTEAVFNNAKVWIL